MPVINLFNKIRTGLAIDNIEEAGASGQKVKVTYTKKNGTKTTRIVRPYEIKAHRTSGKRMLYVTDRKGGSQQIKSYLVKNVSSAKKMPQTFDPVWEVKFKPSNSDSIFERFKRGVMKRIK